MKAASERWLLLLTAGFLGVGIVVLAALVILRLMPSRPPSTQGELIARTWPALASGSLAIGADTARNVLVVFTDYQCRPCRDLDAVTRALLSRYPHSLKVIVRQYPLRTIHPAAEVAALSAICAGQQGSFEIHHSGLFDRQDSLDVASWARWAMQGGVHDTVAFNECLGASTTRTVLAEDLMLFEMIEAKRVPAVILNGKAIGSIVTQARIEAEMIP